MESPITVHRFVPGQPHWWQWLTVLSLDAPLVAVAWQTALARVAGVPLRMHHGCVLGAAVWLAYVADRWIEGWRLVPAQVRTQRHWFYLHWRWAVAVVWLAVLAAALVMSAMLLAPRELGAGLLLLVLVLVYLLSHQFIHLDWPGRAPKEVCVAALFAGGVVCFAAAHRPGMLVDVAVPLGLFTLLCFADCALISLWESEVDRAHGQTSLALQFPRGRAFARGLPWIIAALAAGAALRVETRPPRRPGAPRPAAFCWVRWRPRTTGWAGNCRARWRTWR